MEAGGAEAAVRTAERFQRSGPELLRSGTEAERLRSRTKQVAKNGAELKEPQELVGKEERGGMSYRMGTVEVEKNGIEIYFVILCKLIT